MAPIVPTVQKNFTGHNGVLDLTLSDIAMHIDGSKAGLTADYSSRKFEGMNSHEPGPIETGNDVVFASVNLNSAAHFKSNSVNLAGTTTLTSTGVNVFGGFYEAGIQLDNTVGTLNDTLVEVNGLIVNSGNIMDNSGRLYDRVMGGSGTSGAGTSGTANTNSGTTGSNTTGSNTTGGGTNSTGGTTSGGNSTGGNTTGSGTTGESGGGNTAAAASTAGASGAQSAGASDSSVCQAGDSVGITSAQAQWGVRTSFRNYIAGSIANGGFIPGFDINQTLKQFGL